MRRHPVRAVAVILTGALFLAGCSSSPVSGDVAASSVDHVVIDATGNDDWDCDGTLDIVGAVTGHTGNDTKPQPFQGHLRLVLVKLGVAGGAETTVKEWDSNLELKDFQSGWMTVFVEGPKVPGPGQYEFRASGNLAQGKPISATKEVAFRVRGTAEGDGADPPVLASDMAVRAIGRSPARFC